MTKKKFKKMLMRDLTRNQAEYCAEIAWSYFDSYEHAMQYINVLGYRMFVSFRQ
jgi:hypothetical protein